MLSGKIKILMTKKLNICTSTLNFFSEKSSLYLLSYIYKLEWFGLDFL